MREVAQRGWIAFSHNKRIRRIKEERDIAMGSGLALLFLIGKNYDDIRENLLVTLPKIVRFRNKNDPPFIANVMRPELQYKIGSRPGKVEMSLTLEQWQALRAEEQKDS